MKYPRIASYSTIDGSGRPFISGSTLLQEVVNAQAYCDEIILDAGPCIWRPDVVSSIRAKNPNAKIYAYNLAETYWNSPNPTTEPVQKAINDAMISGGFLMPGVPFRWHFFDGNMIEPFADAIMSTIGAHTNLFDGLFFDLFTPDIGDTGGVFVFDTGSYDPAVDLLTPTQAAAFYKENHFLLMRNLRSRLPSNWLFPTNSGASYANFSEYDGNMREAFPFQQGGTWQTNMLDWFTAGQFHNLGYLDSTFRSPNFSWLCTQPGSTKEVSAQRMRLGLGSATLRDGCWSWGRYEGSITFADRPWMTWRYPEFDGNGIGKGWLGQPLSTYTNWSNSGVYWREFEFGGVLVNGTNSPISVYGLPKMRKLTNSAFKTAWSVPANDSIFLRRSKQISPDCL